MATSLKVAVLHCLSYLYIKHINRLYFLRVTYYSKYQTIIVITTTLNWVVVIILFFIKIKIIHHNVQINRVIYKIYYTDFYISIIYYTYIFHYFTQINVK